MAEYQDLTQALTWLLTNRIQQKISYTHGLLGDGNGRVRVTSSQNSPDVDFVFVRPDRLSDRTFKIFNKRIEGQDGDPIIFGELPWEPDLVQVIDMDWAAYADVGWGDDISTTQRHGISHQWRDGAPGMDTFNIYRRQFGDLKTYSTESGTLGVGVSPYSLDIYGTQYQWPGTQAFSLQGALPAGTGTARMALVYWSSASGTTQGYLGVASGTLGSSSDATILNRPVTPEGAIPSAFVRLKGGQTSVTEFDIWDAREPFRPGILFGTGTSGLSADKIPISDQYGLYTGSTVESALDQIGFDGARVSKLYQSDFEAVALSSDAVGNITLARTGTFSVPTDVIHVGDPDTKISFTDDVVETTVGGVSMLKLTETTQDLVEIGDVAGTGDVDINFNAGQVFLQGSDGFLGIAEIAPAAGIDIVADPAVRVSNVATDATLKISRWQSRHYTNAEPDLTILLGIASSATTAELAFGGGDSPRNPVTLVSFYTGSDASDASTGVERMRINSAGDMGVGTNLPAGRFHAKSGTSNFIVDDKFVGLGSFGFGATLTTSNYAMTGGSTDLFVNRPTGGRIVFRENNSSDQMVIMPTTGFIGINGITVPSTEFDIGDGAIEGEEMTAPGAGAANTWRQYGEDDGSSNTQTKIVFNGGHITTIAKSGGLATYTPTNVVTDRSYDANATTVAELADVLGTLIADFQAAGVLG